MLAADAPAARPVRRHRGRPPGTDRARRAGAPRQPAADQGPRLHRRGTRAFRLRGLLPDRVLTIEEQIELELEHLRRKDDPLERYIGLAALQDRNATLFYRLLAEHLEEFLPIVYTPTVGRACQEFSHIIRRTRGTWITPADRDRIPRAPAPGPVRGRPAHRRHRQRADPRPRRPGRRRHGHPDRQARPVHGGVRDPPGRDPAGLARRRDRQPGPARRPAVPRPSRAAPARARRTTRWSRRSSRASRRSGRTASSSGRTSSSTTRCGSSTATGTACRPSTTTSRARPRSWSRACWPACAGSGRASPTRVSCSSARARRASASRACSAWRCVEDGLPEDDVRRAIVLVDSHGPGPRPARGPRRRPSASSRVRPTPSPGTASRPSIRAWSRRSSGSGRPVLVGTTGVAGTFDEAVISSLAAGTARPIVMPLSNPTSSAEATPADILRWTDGRAIVATGSPFEPVEVDGVRREIGQANNVFIFPGVGLGAIVAEARAITDRMFLLAARTLAEAVSPSPLRERRDLPAGRRAARASRARSRRSWPARRSRPGCAGIPTDTDVDALVDAAMWWPDYVPYEPARPAERRRVERGDVTATRAAVLRVPGAPVADRDADASPSRGRARSASGSSPPGCATPTSTSATASGRARRRSRWATKAPASSRRSVRASGRCRSASRSRCRGSSRAGGAGRAAPAGRGPARIRRRSATGCRTAPRSSQRAAASRSCRTAAIGTMASRDRRPRGGRHPAARRRGPGRGGAHRLLRLDRGRGGAQDGRRRRPARASRSSGSAGSACRA